MAWVGKASPAAEIGVDMTPSGNANRASQPAGGELGGEPLAEGVPRAIAEDLGALLPSARIALFPWVGPRVVQYQVLVEVARFDGPLGGDVALEASWRILGPDRKDVREGRFTHNEPTGEPGYIELVGAMSRSLGALSREIASALPAR